MLAKVLSSAVIGIDAYVVEVRAEQASRDSPKTEPQHDERRVQQGGDGR